MGMVPSVVVTLMDYHIELVNSKVDTYKPVLKAVEKLNDQDMKTAALFLSGTRGRIKHLDRPALVNFISGQLCRVDCFR